MPRTHVRVVEDGVAMMTGWTPTPRAGARRSGPRQVYSTTDTLKAMEEAREPTEGAPLHPIANIRRELAEVDLVVGDRLTTDKAGAIKAKVGEMMLGYQRIQPVSDQMQARLDDRMEQLSKLLDEASQANNQNDYLAKIREFGGLLKQVEQEMSQNPPQP
ncbi:MAG: hypothetical protein WCK47_06015 [bacterium]|nr:hypothetical protein [Candidatus Sumerlaeota bacterium]